MCQSAKKSKICNFFSLYMCLCRKFANSTKTVLKSRLLKMSSFLFKFELEHYHTCFTCKATNYPICICGLAEVQVRKQAWVRKLQIVRKSQNHEVQPVLRVRDVYPGYQIRSFSIPEPGSASKNEFF